MEMFLYFKGKITSYKVGIGIIFPWWKSMSIFEFFQNVDTLKGGYFLGAKNQKFSGLFCPITYNFQVLWGPANLLFKYNSSSGNNGFQ